MKQLLFVILFGFLYSSAQAASADDYICIIRRWHFSGVAGYENLAVVDTLRNSSVGESSGYLYSRSTKDLDEYAVYLKKNTDGNLVITLFKDPKHDHSKRQLIIEHTILNWSDSDAAPTSFQLRDGREFSHDGGGHLEALCYRTRS